MPCISSLVRIQSSGLSKIQPLLAASVQANDKHDDQLICVHEFFTIQIKGYCQLHHEILDEALKCFVISHVSCKLLALLRPYVDLYYYSQELPLQRNGLHVSTSC